MPRRVRARRLLIRVAEIKEEKLEEYNHELETAKRQGDYGGAGKFVAVTNESFNLTKEFSRVRKLNYPIASDIQDLYGRALNVSYIPYAVIVTADGKIVWSGHSGKLSKRRIESVLEEAG